MREEQIGPFVSQFNDAFYVSESAIRKAVRRRSCFNLIHFETSFKVDVFISRGRPFDQICMDRAVAAKLGGDTGFVIVPMATVEDSIISKLECKRTAAKLVFWGHRACKLSLEGSPAVAVRGT